MKNKLIILFLLLNFSGFSQILVRTLDKVGNTADSLKPVSNPQKTAINQKLQTVSSISALQSFTDALIAQYDGSTWEKKSGNVTSNGGSFAGTLIRVSSSVYWERKLNSGYLLPENFGADVSSTDATAQLQQMIDNANGAVIDGGNRQYTVTSLNIPSGTILKNIRLKTKAGSTNFVSPITIIGTSTAKSDIYLYNVHIDGNRANQTSLPSSGFAEDGGRNGFRINGTVTNLTIENCSANYCANDAIAIYSSTSATNSDANFCFKNIKIINFVGNWNRRHGMSIDCVDGIQMINTEFRYNGKDLNTTDAQSVGSRGARVASGFLYGNGCDFEDYGVGTSIQNVNIQNIDVRNNSYAGFVFTSPVNPTATNFYTRKNIKINNIRATQGDDILVGSPSVIDYAGIKIAAFSNVSSLGYTYENVDISDAKIVGRLELRGIKGLKFNGSIEFNIGFFQALVSDSKDVFINSISKGTSRFANTINTINYNESNDGVLNKLRLVDNTVDVDAPVGTGYLNSGSLTVANTRIAGSSNIMLSVKNAIGTQGFLRYSVNPGVGFTIYSTSATEGSLISWLIVN